jgi:hypothetical protein
MNTISITFPRVAGSRITLNLIFFSICSFAIANCLAADWRPVPKLNGYEYDASSAVQDSENAFVWLRKKGADDSQMERYLIKCKTMEIGLVVDGRTSLRDIRPGSKEESLTVLCKSWWQVWK